MGKAIRGGTAMRSILLISLMLALVACTGVPQGVTPVRFEPSRYMGEWYSIARLDHAFERGLTNVSAIYGLKTDGTVSVRNRGFDRARCSWKEIEGSAQWQGPSDVASLSVSFFPLLSGGYHVIKLDPNYQWAMVAGPTRGYLWILARKPVLDAKVTARLVEEARALGFATHELVMVDQSKPNC